MSFFFVLAIIFLLLWDYRKAIIIIAPFKLFFFSLAIGNLPLTSVVSIVSAFFFFGRSTHKDKSFPLTLSFVLLAFSILCSNLHGGFHIKNAIFQISDYLLYIYMLYYCICDRKDIILLFRSCNVFMLLVLCNGFYEFYTLGTNILRDIIIGYSKKGSYFTENSLCDRGYRTCSIYGHSITYGMMVITMAYLYLFFLKGIAFSFNKMIFFVLMLTTVFLTNSRTPLLGLIIYSLPFLLEMKSSGYIRIYIFCIVMSVLYLGGNYIGKSFESIFYSEENDMGGSSIEMRILQFEGVMAAISENIWFGRGAVVGWEEIRNKYYILGGESIVFQVLLRQGIIGIVIYIFFFFEVIKASLRNYYFKYIVILAVGWFVMQFSTSTIDISDYPMLLAFVIYYKIGIFKQNEEIVHNHSCI